MSRLSCLFTVGSRVDRFVPASVSLCVANDISVSYSKERLIVSPFLRTARRQRLGIKCSDFTG